MALRSLTLRRQDLNESERDCKPGDLLEIGGTFWVVEENIASDVVRLKSANDVAARVASRIKDQPRYSFTRDAYVMPAVKLPMMPLDIELELKGDDE